jgi:hypothetical protein
MAVNAFVSITFEAASPDDVKAAVEAMNPPEGASVSVTVHETVVTGIVTGGVVVDPTQAQPAGPITNGEPT